MVLFCVNTEQQIVGGDAGADAGAGAHYTQLCAGCHDPVNARTGNYSFPQPGGPSAPKASGVTCLGCHDVTREIRAGGNADLVATRHDWTQDHAASAKASLATLKQPEFCGGCHTQFVPGSGLIAIGTLPEYHASPYSPSTRCVDCHMPQMGQSGVFDHRFPGGNVYLSTNFGQQDLTNAQVQNLIHVVTLAARRVESGVLVTITNGGAGHGFPTGVTDIREPWVEVQAFDGNGNLLDKYGGPDPNSNRLPPNAARLGTDIAQADGRILLKHELSLATRVPYDVRVPAGESQTLFVPVPASLPPGTASLDAVLYYRNVRTTYFQSATGESDGGAPTTEMARVTVP